MLQELPWQAQTLLWPLAHCSYTWAPTRVHWHQYCPLPSPRKAETLHREKAHPWGDKARGPLGSEQQQHRAAAGVGFSVSYLVLTLSAFSCTWLFLSQWAPFGAVLSVPADGARRRADDRAHLQALLASGGVRGKGKKRFGCGCYLQACPQQRSFVTLGLGSEGWYMLPVKNSWTMSLKPACESERGDNTLLAKPRSILPCRELLPAVQLWCVARRPFLQSTRSSALPKAQWFGFMHHKIFQCCQSFVKDSSAHKYLWWEASLTRY